MSKYKYYFRKPRSEIVKDILKWLLMPGKIYLDAGYPFIKELKKYQKNKEYKNKKYYDVFYRLRKEGCIKMGRINNQVYMELTDMGRKKAGWMQINDIKVKRPKKWDNRWRIVAFDISQVKNFYREVFRGKLKELAFYPLQKSVWISPFECSDEVDLLKDFLGLTDKEVRFFITDNIGEDADLRKIFKI
ncbi:MAG: hypothetical protein PHW43_08910 [Syntrophales bacterium]|nr:hypothetical protein [Syntrophales bacterium]